MHEPHTGTEKGFDYDYLTDFILLGTNMCCLEGYAEELLTKDVRADISLEQERIDNPTGVEFFLWLPVVDAHAPTQEQLAMGAQALAHFTQQGIRAYVHCKNGHGRAPTLVAAYFISTGMTPQEAIAAIVLKRPSVHPNEEQRTALETFWKRTHPEAPHKEPGQ
jgi:protein-tyrosine phosphatase